jgi:HlyD family secretion protein
MKTIAAIVVTGVLAAGAFFWSQVNAPTAEGPNFRLGTAERRDVALKIAASGTIEPEEIVDVGAQVAGKITAFGVEPDSEKPIDYGSPVEPGTVLARIDDALYLAEVQLARSAFHQAEHQKRNAEAGVTQAKANLKRAEAELGRTESTLGQAEKDVKRLKLLSQSKGVSPQEVELAETALSTALAQRAVSEAAIEQAKAALEMAQIAVGESQAKVEGAAALLNKAEKNLEYTTIRSPIRGVIVDRRVNIGQTVVSNLNAPSLFLIAKDLRKLEVWASVNEADIGTVRVGLPVEFSVDAFPGETFRGSVKQVRLNATMTQSVVTYTVVVGVDNEAGKLLPYLTANVRFIVAEKPDVLTVPSAATRWKPKPEQVALAFRDEFAAQSHRKGGGKRQSAEAGGASSKAVVWVLDGAFVKPIKVETGLADANHIEIKGGDLTEGTEVIVGEAAAVKKQTKNPFAPSLTQGLER